MTPIERVRAVLASGNPGPFVANADGTAIGHADCDGECVAQMVSPVAGNATKLALAVNLAPAFVALWEAAEEYHEHSLHVGIAKDECSVCQALAALNAAAAREVGE